MKVVLSNPIIRSIVQIVGCAAAAAVLGPAGPAGCAAVSALVTLGSGGSLRDALKAAAITFASIGIFSAVGPTLNAIASTGVGGVLIKAGAHGVIGGALSVAQGGSFLQGFAGSAIGALGGAVAGGEGGIGIAGQYRDGIFVNQLARALISGAAGCAGAIVTGGKCAQAAVTAAFGSLYNGDGLRFAASAAGGAGGAYLGAAGGGGLAALCAGLTGGACAVFAPYIVAGGTWLGRYGGAFLGGAVADWVQPTTGDGDGTTLESRKFNSEGQRAGDDRARNPVTGKEECFFCGKEVDPNPGKPNSKQYDHWWPWSKGGQSTAANAEVTCATCNGPGGKWYKLPWNWR